MSSAMIDGADEFLEQAIREAWAAAGFGAQHLPPRDDQRMQRMMQHLRTASRRLLEDEIVHLRQREAALEERLADIEERVGELEARVGLDGITLQ